MTKLVHPSIMKYKNKIEKLRKEVKQWKSMHRNLLKKYDAIVEVKQKKIYRPHLRDSGWDF